MARDQLEVPNALDVAKNQLYDFTTIVIAGMGFFTAAYDLFSISVVTKHAELSLPPKADYVWRIILMFGAVPATMTYYWRMKMPETTRYTAKVLNVEFDPEEANLEKFVKEPSNEYGLFSKEFLHRHGLHLLGTATCWFLLDISFYSQNLFQNYIFTIINWLPPAANMSGIEEVYKVSRAQTLIALCSTVPGYWFTVFFVDKIGRWIIQLQGFFFMTVFMFALGIPFHHWTLHKVPFIIMYSLTFFFANFGPNSTTFVLPAEIFPARLRSTCHGISAAAGKAGAIVGAFGFLYTSEPRQRSQDDAGYPPGIIGVKYSFIVLGFVSLFGMVFTFLIPESNGKSLEELSGENEDDSIDAVEESTLDRQGRL